MFAAAAAASVALASVAPSSGALSITTHFLPEYRCGARLCPPTVANANALMGISPNRVLLGGTAGASAYGEATVGPSVTLTPGPTGAPAYAIVRGPDGNPWVLDYASGVATIQDVTPGALVARYQYSPGTTPTGIAAGFGAMWVSNVGVDRLGPSGELTEYPLPTKGLQDALQLVSGPNDSMWFTDGNGAIGQITADGTVVEYSSVVPNGVSPLGIAGKPESIAVGPDGALWYTDANHSRIGRMTSTGEVQEFPVPDEAASPFEWGRPEPASIVAGPEGEYMYFVDSGDDSIGRISMSGEVVEYPVPFATYVSLQNLAVVGNELVFDGFDVPGERPLIGTVDPTASPGEAPLGPLPSITAIESSLSEQLALAIRTAQVTFLRGKHAFAVPFEPLEHGTITFEWLAPPPSAHKQGAQASSATVVAVGEQGFELTEPGTVSVKLTSAGRRLLKSRARRHEVTRLLVWAKFNDVEVSAQEILGR